MKIQENNSLKYRQTLVDAKRAWDKNPKQKIFRINNGLGKTIALRQSELAIYGGGVAILSRAEGLPILLYSPLVQKYFKIKEDADEYEFLNTPYKLFEKEPHFSNFIDLLFFVSRNTPKPEYVSNISDIVTLQPFEYPFQLQLRKQYEILHCSSGEILLFCLLWRLLIELINRNNNLDCIYSENRFSVKGKSTNWINVFSATKHDLIEKMIIDKLDVAKKSPQKALSKSIFKASDIFKNSIKEEGSIKYIFDGLGLFKKESLSEFNKYVQFVFKDKSLNLTKSDADNFAHKIILAFADKAKVNPKHLTLGNLLDTLHKKSRFPILPYYFLTFFDDKKELKEHLVFPLWYTTSPDTKYIYEKVKEESAVLHALYTIKPIWKNKKYKSSDWYTANNKVIGNRINSGFENYLNDLYSFFTSMSKPIIDKEYYAEEANKNINIVKRQATKAAISQVMARNMSHNIGSHVLSRMIKWNDIAKFTKNYSSSLSHSTKSNEELIEYFNSYLKTRMDFLADIATSTPTIQSTKQFVSELLKGFDDNRLLLNKISGIADFNFSIKVFKDGKELTEKVTDNSKEEIKIIGDFPVSISNDVLGFHAFYIILENIIRNTAKHSYSGKKNQSLFEFRIDVKDTDANIDNSFYEITVSDGVKLTDNVPLEKDDVRKYKAILAKGAATIKRIDKLIFDQNTRLNKSILDEENKLRQGAWGLIEMDVSAAYLRKIAQEDVDDDKYHIPVTEAEKKKFSKDKAAPFRIIEAIDVNGCLGYKFYLPKPKELLIIDSSGTTWDKLVETNPNAPNEWKNKGILFLKKNSAVNDKWLFKKEYSYPHELVLFLDAEKTIQSPFISKRQVTLEELKQCYKNYHNKDRKQEEQITDIDILNLPQEDLITEVWRAWNNKRLNERKLAFKESGKITYGEFFPFHGDYADYEIKLDPHGESYNGITNREYREVFPKSLFSHLHDKIIETEPTQEQLAEKFKFVDSTLTNVLVLDERIQELVLKERYYPEKNTINFNGFSFKELWDNVNVYVPEKSEINLTEKNFSKSYIKSIHNIIDDKLMKGNRIKVNSDGKETSRDIRVCKGLDFIVIHLGVIEKILKGQNNDKKDEKEIGNFISQLTAKYSDVTVIITSGRGKPENLPNNIPYLGYSIISQYLVENRFKSLFTQMLYSARPQNR